MTTTHAKSMPGPGEGSGGSHFIRVFGPNLSRAAQKKGQFHVHAEGCGDCRHYGPDNRFGGDDPDGWHMQVANLREVVEHVYEDQIREAGDDESYIAGLEADFFFAPCVDKVPS